MINFLVIALTVIAGMLLLRFVLHYYFPSWGTVLANAIAGLGLFSSEMLGFIMSLLSDAQSLPWSSILEQAQAQAVTFGILVANMIMRKIGPKAKV